MVPTVIRNLGRSACVLALSACLSAVASESSSDVAHQPCPASAVRVFLSGSGGVLLNGRSVEASRLSTELTAIKPQPTLVCYSRERPWGKPPSTVKVVLDALIALKVPLRFYTDATFTTPAPVTTDAAL
jgi:hypothetical protein